MDNPMFHYVLRPNDCELPRWDSSSRRQLVRSEPIRRAEAAIQKLDVAATMPLDQFTRYQHGLGNYVPGINAYD